MLDKPPNSSRIRPPIKSSLYTATSSATNRMTFAPISAACGSSLAAIAIKSGTNLVHRLAPSCRTTSAINVAALDLTAYASPPPPSLTSRSIPCANAAISILSLSLIVRHRPRTNSRSVAYPKCLASSARARAHSDRHVSIAIRQSPRFNCVVEKYESSIARVNPSRSLTFARASLPRHRVSSRARARSLPNRSVGRSVVRACPTSSASATARARASAPPSPRAPARSTSAHLSTASDAMTLARASESAARASTDAIGHKKTYTFRGALTRGHVSGARPIAVAPRRDAAHAVARRRASRGGVFARRRREIGGEEIIHYSIVRSFVRSIHLREWAR